MKTDPTGRVALAFDELLCDPDLAPIAAQLRDRVPTALLDQCDAAAAHVHANLDTAARGWGVDGQVGYTAPSDVPGWVRLGALTTLAGWLTGRASTCLHAPHPTRPQPLAAAAWKPGLIVCGRCTHLLTLPRRSTADRTCDGCGHVVTGVEHHDGIRPTLIVVGALSYLFGTCRDCTVAAPRRAAASPTASTP